MIGRERSRIKRRKEKEENGEHSFQRNENEQMNDSEEVHAEGWTERVQEHIRLSRN